jgi:hypothetical protein
MAKSNWKKRIKPLASIKLAVFVIIAMGIMSAWGTIVESIYNDARRAQETVYHSWYSYGIFILLTINLIAVIVDRYPWKRHHVGFISAHIGIIILIIGSVMTRYMGVDASMAFNIGESKNRLMSSETDLIVYSGLMSGGVRKVYEKEVHFLKSPPQPDKPFVIEVGNDKIIIDDFRPYSIPQSKIEPSDKSTDGPGLRFQISNERVSESDWLLMGNQAFDVKDMGPAKFVLAKKEKYKYAGGNVLLLETSPQSEELEYSIFTESQPGRVQRGRVKPGDSIQTGWMGLTFRVLKYLPGAKEVWTYEPLERATDETIQSIRFQFNGKEYWTGLNSSVRLFSDENFYVFIYANRLLELDFALHLDEFRVGRYQGTRRAASYESDVSVVENNQKGDRVTISMNEPLKHRGYTFYQASFKEDEMGRPVMSILSVNKDPGRFWKYLGSLLIVFGIFHLFYLRSRRA